ncbi:MAG: DsbA family protein [Pseudomonadota bacterium]
MRSFALATVLAAAFALAGTLTFVYLNPAEEVVEGPPPLQQADVETIVRDYLIENPEILEEVSIALQEKRIAEEAERRIAAIAENQEALFNSPLDHATGNLQGDVTVVEFFDYNCPYCKRGHADLVDLVASDPNIRLVYKEFPVLGPGSVEATRVALAAGRQGRYLDMHKRLITLRGPADTETALAEARDLGLDMDQLEADMQDPELMRAVEEAHRLAGELGITGTPSYVVGDQVIVGAVGFAELQDQVATAREETCVTC